MSIDIPKVGEFLSMIKDNDWLSLLFALSGLIFIALSISSSKFKWPLFGSPSWFFGIGSILFLAFIPTRAYRINKHKERIKKHEEKIYSEFCQKIKDLKKQTHTQIEVRPETFQEMFPSESIEKLRGYLEKAYNEGLIRKKQNLFYICNY